MYSKIPQAPGAEERKKLAALPDPLPKGETAQVTENNCTTQTERFQLLPNACDKLIDRKSSFNMLDHIEKLEPAKAPNRYYCPACGDDNFTFNAQTGAYQCWGNGCTSPEIREAITPWAERQSTNFQPSKVIRAPKRSNRVV